MKVRWSRSARNDLAAIGAYIARDSFRNALRTREAITERVAMLGRFPNMGRIGVVPGTREMVCSPLPYIAVYKVDDAAVYILRIMHGAQRWP